MTQYPSGENVRGDFEDVRLEFAGDTYYLEREGDEFWVDMVDPDWKYAQSLKEIAHREGRGDSPSTTAAPPRVKKRITLMTGSHHMQTYWVPSHYGNMQFNLPFTFIFEANRWAPRHDVFLLSPSKHYTMQIWNMNCVSCHATAGQPRQDASSKVMETRAAEMGISCEACHGPGEEHVGANLSPVRRYMLHAKGTGDPTIFNPGRADHTKASDSCGQCHAIRRKTNPDWAQDGLHFRPGQNLEEIAPLVRFEPVGSSNTPSRKRSVIEGSFWSDGQVRVSGRDFNGLAESPCFQRGSLSCMSCHSLHQYESNDDQLARGMHSNKACLQCHTRFVEQLEHHTHHRTESSGSLCYNCHMPHTSYGLLKAIRSHTINSPNLKSTLQTGRPIACNLCHLDKTLRWTSDHLVQWYGHPEERLDAEQANISASVALLLSGDAGQRALMAWHAGWETAWEASGHEWIAPYLAELLTDPYSVVRYIAQRSLKRLPHFGDLNYDYIASPKSRLEAQHRARAIWESQRPSFTVTNQAKADALLLDMKGSLRRDRFADLLRRRNDRQMELLE